MKNSKVLALPFKRKRKGRTYYKRRLRLLLSNKFRFVVRKSLKNLEVSVAEYNAKGDRIIFTVSSKVLNKTGWMGDNGNLPSAYLTGKLAAKKAFESGISEAILDLGYYKSTKGSRLYAAVAGAIDAGLKIPVSPDVLPSKERISGEHIAKYASELKNDISKYQRQFSSYIKKGMYPENVKKHFDEIRIKI